MTENIDDTEPEPQNDGGRNIWKRLDLLLSFAESQTRDASHNDPNSLLWVLNYLWEVESLLQQELDYAVISLKEFWRYRSTDIAAAMGTKWEHDRSHLIVAVPDNEMGVPWRAAQKRYREALRRQFGPDTEMPCLEYFELYKDDILWRRRMMNLGPAETPPPKPEKDSEMERFFADSDRLQRVVLRLKRRGKLPAGIQFGYRSHVDGAAGIIAFTTADESGTHIGDCRIPQPDDPKHPYRGVEELVLEVEKRARELATEGGLNSDS